MSGVVNVDIGCRGISISGDPIFHPYRAAAIVGIWSESDTIARNSPMPIRSFNRRLVFQSIVSPYFQLYGGGWTWICIVFQDVDCFFFYRLWLYFIIYRFENNRKYDNDRCYGDISVLIRDLVLRRWIDTATRTDKGGWPSTEAGIRGKHDLVILNTPGTYIWSHHGCLVCPRPWYRSWRTLNGYIVLQYIDGYRFYRSVMRDYVRHCFEDDRILHRYRCYCTVSIFICDLILRPISGTAAKAIIWSKLDFVVLQNSPAAIIAEIYGCFTIPSPGNSHGWTCRHSIIGQYIDYCLALQIIWFPDIVIGYQIQCINYFEYSS